MSVPCPVHSALKPTAKLACDTGRGSQFRVWYNTNKGGGDTNVKYNNNPNKTGVPQNAPVGSWRAGMQLPIRSASRNQEPIANSVRAGDARTSAKDHLSSVYVR